MVVNGDEYIPPDGWREVDIPEFPKEVFRIWVNHFKSNSDRMNAFIKDPRSFMRGQPMGEEFGGIKGEPIEGVGDATRISTWITNHQNTLMRMVLYATAIVSETEGTCAVTLYKHGPGGD